MMFSELYGAYYNAVANILKSARKRTVNAAFKTAKTMVEGGYA